MMKPQKKLPNGFKRLKDILINISRKHDELPLSNRERDSLSIFDKFGKNTSLKVAITFVNFKILYIIKG